MRKILTFLTMLCTLGMAGAAMAHTVTFNWTWPTTNQDGTALALSAITAATIYDTTTSVPMPGSPGTAVICVVSPLPPTAATGTCTTGTIAAGTHTYELEVSNSTGLGAPTSILQVVVPQSTPNAATNFTATVNNP